MDISTKAELPIRALDALARDILGDATCGVSAGNGVARIHLLQANEDTRRRCADILANFGALTLSATAIRLDEGAADPVISCRDQAISADSELGYLVTLDGETYAQGSDSVSAGVLSLTLSRPAAGEYVVFVWRKRGNFASGSLKISVNEV